jgi:hypothetical protein
MTMTMKMMMTITKQTRLEVVAMEKEEVELTERE